MDASPRRVVRLGTTDAALEANEEARVDGLSAALSVVAFPSGGGPRTPA